MDFSPIQVNIFDEIVSLCSVGLHSITDLFTALIYSTQESSITALNYGNQFRYSITALNYGTHLWHSITALNYDTQVQHSITALKYSTQLQH